MIKPTYFFQKIKMYIAVNIIYKNIILYNFEIVVISLAHGKHLDSKFA